MNIAELHTELQHFGIPGEEYYLHGLYGSTVDNDKYGTTIKQGKYTIDYEVYFCERSEKHSSRTFTSEYEACDYFFRRLTETWRLEQH